MENDKSLAAPVCTSSTTKGKCSRSSSRRKLLRAFLNLSFLVVACSYFLILSPAASSSFSLQENHNQPIRLSQLHNDFPLTVDASAEAPTTSSPSSSSSDPPAAGSCPQLAGLDSHSAKCLFLTTTNQCPPEGYIDYLRLFYCSCSAYPSLGYTLLLLWLSILFYILGNTAATYFCSSLEGLSSALRLSPTIAGVTLLSLGNGAPDVFSSVASFMGDGTEDVGLNSVLGGALFVSCVVTGVICVCVGDRGVVVDRSSFVRDVGFFLVALLALLGVIVAGEVGVWGSAGLVGIYLTYVVVVYVGHFCRKKDVAVVSFHNEVCEQLHQHHLPIHHHLVVPLLGVIDQSSGEYSDEYVAVKIPADTVADEDDADDDGSICRSARNYWFTLSYYCSGKILQFLELPLYLPRRLTIPDVNEDRWSKPIAVVSVTLAPLLLAMLWTSQNGDSLDSKTSLFAYAIAACIGTLLGVLAFCTTDSASPPQTCLFPWVAGGFLMSVVWTYITADELVSLLVSLGTILGISPAVLGLTVLAWGNSLGDLIANAAMAWNGGCDGAQVAISGCYAGPIFNTLVGLGLSMSCAAWASYPAPYPIALDASLFQTLGFLAAGLLWALVILPARGMQLDRVLGVGLLAIYACFLSIRLAQSTGLIRDFAVPL